MDFCLNILCSHVYLLSGLFLMNEDLLAQQQRKTMAYGDSLSLDFPYI